MLIMITEKKYIKKNRECVEALFKQVHNDSKTNCEVVAC